MKKIIIAGGTGFLGNCLKDHHSGTDTRLVILTRGKARVEEIPVMYTGMVKPQACSGVLIAKNKKSLNI